MLHLVFENPGLPKIDAGPFDSVEVTSEALWGMPGRTQLAVHENHMWVFRGMHYTSILIRTPCLLRFQHDGENCSTARAKENEARIVNGAIYHGSDLVATLMQNDNAWRIYEDKAHCNRAEIFPAEE